MCEEAAETLRVGEAVELAHALLSRLAEIEGVRVLFIKGPTAVQMGARPARPSSDVDVLCEPGGMERIGAALQRRGWRRRVPESAKPQLVYTAKYLFEHSVHYIHDEWPCDLDIHYNFPGFLAPEEVVFEALWERRAMAKVAHWPVPCADFTGQAAIVGLHALRDRARDHPDLPFLKNVLAGEQHSARRQELSSLAAGTGSSQTLGPLLEAVGAPAIAGPWDEGERLTDWRLRQTNARIPTATWLLELRHTPWARRPALIYRAAFPSPRALLAQHVGLEDTPLNVTLWRLRRLRRAVPQLLGGARASKRALEGQLDAREEQ